KSDPETAYPIVSRISAIPLIPIPPIPIKCTLCDDANIACSGKLISTNPHSILHEQSRGLAAPADRLPGNPSLQARASQTRKRRGALAPGGMLPLALNADLGLTLVPGRPSQNKVLVVVDHVEFPVILEETRTAAANQQIQPDCSVIPEAGVEGDRLLIGSRLLALSLQDSIREVVPDWPGYTTRSRAT